MVAGGLVGSDRVGRVRLQFRELTLAIFTFSRMAVLSWSRKIA